MSKLSQLRAASTLHELASLIDFTPKGLAFVAYRLQAGQRYTFFEIKKATGGSRQIAAPSSPLKLAQRRIADLLQDCIEGSDVEFGRTKNGRHRPSSVIHGFARGRSILTNANVHRKKKLVLNADIMDFFPSISFGRVRGLLIKDRRFQLHPKVATIVAQIACFQGHLPQGSPCSPVIANLVGRVLDAKLLKISKKYNCSYSRYADDITISTSRDQFPASLAIRQADGKWLPGSSLLEAFESSKFRLNFDKFRVQARRNRQLVTGLTVNQKANVRPEIRRLSRAMVNRLVTTGSFDWPMSDGSSRDGTESELHGLLSFIDHVDEENFKLDQRDPNRQLTSKREPLRRFLLYTIFFASKSPLIVCEGKTDNIYLVHAFRALADTFPDLATKMPDGTIKVNVRRFKYSGSSTEEIVGLKGGTAPLTTFATNFGKAARLFRQAHMSQPVILIVDNDEAGRKVLSAVGSQAKKKQAFLEPYIHVAANLYVCPVPSPDGSPKVIEDLFDAETRNYQIGDRSLSLENEWNADTHYGKNQFAREVVAERASEIDFCGFIPLLTNISAVLKAHSAKSAGSGP